MASAEMKKLWWIFRIAKYPFIFRGIFICHDRFGRAKNIRIIPFNKFYNWFGIEENF